MTIVLWVIQCLLALALAGFGIARLVRSREQVVGTFPYLEQFPTPAIRALGVCELAAGLGLVLPGLIGIAPVLVPLAALGALALALAGTALHWWRSETTPAAINSIFIALLILTAWGRSGPYPL